MFRLPSILAAITGLAISCASQAACASPAGHFVEASAALRSDAEYEAWYRAGLRLRDQFDEICGDTFCEGDYSNLQPLRFQCSVEPRRRQVGECTWSFAGSLESIDPASGRIAAEPGFWQCRIPLAPRTSLDRLLETLDSPQPLHAPLPGTGRTVLDGLIDCL